jgi:hypothetical protein
MSRQQDVEGSNTGDQAQGPPTGDSVWRTARWLGIGLFALAAFVGARDGLAGKNAKGKPAATAKPASNEMEVEGLTGELDAASCEKLLAEKQPDFRKCYDAVATEKFYLNGRMRMKLLIGPGGQPKSVALQESTLGSIEIESCVVDTLLKLHFSPPKGGDGELSYPLAFSGRAPVGSWEPERIAEGLKKKRAALLSCKGKAKKGAHLAAFEDLRMTLYVGPGGKVTSAGFSALQPIDAKLASCVAQKALTLELDDPLGQMVKVSYDMKDL